ncbi:carbamoyltransferase HypF [Clostridium sp.]|uniref:carbamoyltransferase HypF n=1 Tax=Clostridium sp. TaxID=1506 RepID=UPI002FC68715
MIRKNIIVKGIVQGVGFRPFVYKIATYHNLKGTVCNTSKGVLIDVEGKSSNIDSFISNIKEKSPKLSFIESVEELSLDTIGFKDFKIIDSIDFGGRTLISPDIGVCDECIKEIEDKYDRRREAYPFTNCTNCGPRFSIIKSIPYDRKFTTMDSFHMCNNCKEEYLNIVDRRFHAEPTCCNECGPKLELLDKYGDCVNCNDELNKTRNLIKEGYILGIKGIGGYNIVCRADFYNTIDELRRRKRRVRKPLAVMMKDIETVKKYCLLSNKEEEMLKDSKKPIVILKKKNNDLPNNISFSNNTLGVVLPYSPLHHLLFKDGIDKVIFTSGNITKGQMIYEDYKAIDKLKEITDYLLVHNREINMPVDDSVVFECLGEERVIRAGRGYAPISIKKDTRDNTLALGGQLKNTFSLSSKDYIFISPYIGDMETLESLENFKKNVIHLKNIYHIDIKKVCYDMHPSYWYSKYLDEINVKKVGIYHHHAHIASCIGENDYKGKVIGIAFDGTGYGEDKNIWGGEFLICDLKSFKRYGQVNYFKLVGGDSATKNPWKIGLALIRESLKLGDSNIYKEFNDIFNVDKDKFNLLCNMIDKNLNVSLCSSVGRLFDGICSILGFNDEVSFEGEYGIYLENLANKFKVDNENYKEKYCYEIKKAKDVFGIKTEKLIRGIVRDLRRGVTKEEIALKFHNTIIYASSSMALILRNETKINTVALSGGVFQNRIILEGLCIDLENKGFNVITNKKIPCNDSGLSYGQLLISDELM